MNTKQMRSADDGNLPEQQERNAGNRSRAGLVETPPRDHHLPMQSLSFRVEAHVPGEWKPIHLSPNAQYHVAFFKHLLSSDGHQFKCLQCVIKIRHARNAERAIKAAEHRYERLCHVPDWRL